MPLVSRCAWEVAVHQVNEEDEQGEWSRAQGGEAAGGTVSLPVRVLRNRMFRD